MSLKKLMTNSADYNAWVNLQYVNWLSEKSMEFLNKEIPSRTNCDYWKKYRYNGCTYDGLQFL